MDLDAERENLMEGDPAPVVDELLELRPVVARLEKLRMIVGMKLDMSRSMLVAPTTPSADLVPLQIVIEKWTGQLAELDEVLNG